MTIFRPFAASLGAPHVPPAMNSRPKAAASVPAMLVPLFILSQ